MDLYLINVATDAKRQPCLNMTEASIWDYSEAIIQLGVVSSHPPLGGSIHYRKR